MKNGVYEVVTFDGEEVENESFNTLINARKYAWKKSFNCIDVNIWYYNENGKHFYGFIEYRPYTVYLYINKNYLKHLTSSRERKLTRVRLMKDGTIESDLF